MRHPPVSFTHVRDGTVSQNIHRHPSMKIAAHGQKDFYVKVCFYHRLIV
ncbi:hypothetical protein [Bacillus alveayuensis]|nr:hypothetical protein [Bacillus alveayuensis]